MRAVLLSALAFATLLGGCDAYGGADGGDGEAATFTVTGRAPGPGTSGVAVTSFVEVTFSALVDTGSVDADAILLSGSAVGTITVNGRKLRFTPAVDLVQGTAYAVTLSPTLKGRNGLPLGSSPVWGFKTSGPTPPPDTLPPLGPRPR
jgi:hypothetical protein